MTRLLLLSYDVSLDSGGIQNTGYILSEYLSRTMELTIICGAQSKPPCSKNIKCYKIDYEQSGLDFFNKRVEELVLELSKKERFDFALSMLGTFGFSLYNLKHRIGLPYGVLVHGSELFKPHFVFKKKNARGVLSLFKWILLGRRYYIKRWKNTLQTLEYADLLFSNTNYTKSLLGKYVSNNNIRVIHPPIYSLPKVEIEIKRNHDLFSVGRLTSRKGFQFVIQALPKVRAAIPDIKYRIAGVGEMESELKAMVHNLQLDECVDFLGRIDDDTKNKLMRECGAFVTTSYTEPKPMDVESFGIVYVEANAFGKYVIAANTGGVGEAVIDGETGILVEQGNINQITDAIIKVFSDGFTYNPQKCIENAKRNHISVISESYYNEINSFLKTKKNDDYFKNTI